MRLTPDIPPVWLALAIAVAWVQARFLPVGPSLAHPITDVLASVLIWVGIALIALAAFAFWRARTTIIPHNRPSALVTSGIFAISRNPIYLADALILTGLILSFDAVLSLALVPLFVWFITVRFIHAEEARIRDTFGQEFIAYSAKVRRWL
ncbi:MAG: isoprenylcysteine carboxylmethyltransferase family protein [Pseudomonadota bacterium]